MHDPAVLRPNIRDYLEAENAYKEATLAPARTLRSVLSDEFRARIKEDDSSVPAKDGEWEYYQRYREGGQHPVVCRHPAEGSVRGAAGDENGSASGHVAVDADTTGEEILLDGDAEAEGKSYYRVGSRDHAWNHQRFAWTVDENGSEFYTLRVMDLDSGERLDDVIERCSGGFTWAADHRTLFYTVLDDNHRPVQGPPPPHRHRCRRRRGRLRRSRTPGFFLNVSVTESRRFVVIDAHNHVTSEVRLIEAERPERHTGPGRGAGPA